MNYKSKTIFKIFISLSLCAFVFVSAYAQTKRTVTHEDVWLMKRVGAPIPSPDGKWVVFNVVDPSYDEKEQWSDIWIVPADGSAAPRRLTSSKASEGGATWSPDSKSIAFTAKRESDEANQVYILPMEGGEAIKVTDLSTGARNPKFSPDGKLILFASSVFPGTKTDEENKKIAAERKARKYKVRAYEGFPIRNWDRWLDDLQTHIFVQSLEPGAKVKDIIGGTQLVSLAGFSAGDDVTWTPDGSSLVFSATVNRNAAAYADVFTNIYQVAVSGGEPKEITSGKDSYGRPTFTPDGKTLLTAFGPSNDKVFNLNRIVTYAWPSMSDRKVLTASFDGSPSSIAISSDSKTVYFTAESAGHENIYSVPIGGGQVKISYEAKVGVNTNLAIASKSPATFLYVNWESATSPAEIFRLAIPANEVTEKKLTNFNKEKLAGLDIPALREFWFTSKKGKKIHSFLALPPNFDENKKYPIFVFIHGGPHTMTRDQFFLRWNYHLLAQPGYVILMTDYTGSTGYGEKFAQEIQGDPLKGPGEELNEAADEAGKQFKFIDLTRQAAGGASYGGHLANWLQGTTTRYKCLISHAGLVNIESQWATSDAIYHREVGAGGPVWEQGRVWREQNPIRLAANFKTPMLVTVGENDFRVPLNNSLENWSVLQRMQVPSKLLVFPEENHWILRGENNRYFFTEVQAWLKKWLSVETAKQ